MAHKHRKEEMLRGFLKDRSLPVEVKKTLFRSTIEEQENWIEIKDKIPVLNFPSDWEVRIIPPFGGAVARFFVGKKGKKGYVSVYLDWYDNLASFGKPYWEVYPVRGDNERYDLNDIGGLMRAISIGLLTI